MKKNVTKAFYNGKEQLYPETDALGVDLGASLLQMRDDMLFPKNEAPVNAMMWPVAFVSKSIISAETCYSNTQKSKTYSMV